jgi:hypothetical protein
MDKQPDRPAGWPPAVATVTLDREDIEAIAVRAAHHVVQLLERPGPGAFQLLEPKQLAAALNVSLDYVYAHAADLGVMRLGDGPKARLRFDLQTARAAMRSRKQPPTAAAAQR